jgi:hypothetical protein
MSERDFPRGRKTTVGWAVAALAVAMTLATSGTARAADWQFWQLDADSLYDAATIDTDGNGVFNEIDIDLDNDGYWDTRYYNTLYSDAFHERLEFDMDENLEIEFRLVDGDQREGFDYVYADRDQNGFWDLRRGKARQIIPRSNIDDITRINRHNASRNLMHSFTMRTGGQSLLYPSPPTPY